ncbi:hypothetical protein ACFQV2_21955 [Actinokineospora soli]|uniref:Uncharacterized protein n=1 Tax=Actinokineospora soli TaxID=1048753 RepID=A0ABW2TQZ1_9PSEU
MHRVGSATVHSGPDTAHALFTPDEHPLVSVRPAERGHAARAAAWALRVLGHGHTGGRVVLIADPGAGPPAEALAAVLAVDDALTGGLAPLLRDPALLRRISAAEGIPLP